jgi:recombination protein RecT
MSTDDFLDPNEGVKGAIAKRRTDDEQQQAEGQLTVAKVLDKRLSNIMPDLRKRETFVGQLTIMREASPKLAKCTSSSLINCMIACGHLDLMPNTAQQYAFIIPYGDQAQFQLGYLGLIELAYRSGEITSINAELVFAEDKFEQTLGTRRELVHIPNLDIDRTKYDNVKRVYATAELKNGKSVFVVLTMDEINKIRASSKASKGGDNPWNKWPEAMAKKTAIKRLLKYLPSSAIDNRFKDAIDYDNRAEAGKLAFKEDNTLDLDADTQLATAPERPKDKGIKTYAKPEPREAEIVETEDKAAYTPPSENDIEHPNSEVEEFNDTLEMSDEDLRDGITEMLDYLKFDDTQLANIYALAGTSDFTLADHVALAKVFVKLDEIVGRDAEQKAANKT